MNFWTLAVSLFVFGNCVNGNPDEVLDLPGLKLKPSFRHYSGYLNATQGKFLHYWFVESQNDPANDPVLLWLNGGPGCSSLDGFLTELGPFHVMQNGKDLYNNPFTWNKVANVIFLEAPAGVGFSYSLSGNYSINDDQVAEDNYLALQHFFIKFPQFKKNEFYVTGESYGGIYVPTLSYKIFTGSASFNFKGFAVGNGYLNAKFLGNSIVFFAYYHGLVGKDVWSNLTSYCCSGGVSQETCDFVQNSNPKCLRAVDDVERVVSSGLNVYNLYADCAPSASLKYSRMPSDHRNLLRSIGKLNLVGAVQDSPPCIDSRNVAAWLNQEQVRTALHIPNTVQNWTICSDVVERGYIRIYNTMKPQVLKMAQSGKVKVLIYNGDVDMACNFLGDEWFVDDLGLKLVSDYKKWEYNNQVAGFVKVFENLAFVTVKGSGHMVPQDKPGQALKMITSFLQNEPL